MRTCPACDCHVLLFELSCPHCTAPLAPASGIRKARVGATALSAGLTMLACTTDTEPGDTMADATTTTMGDGDGDGDASTSTTDATTDETFTTDEPEPAYGVPETPCADFGPDPVSVGANAITIDAQSNGVFQTCGGSGSASFFAFTAPAAGDYEFSISDADFTPVISLYGGFCDEFNELQCALPPETLTQSVQQEGTILHIGIDSDEGAAAGSATLTITQL